MPIKEGRIEKQSTRRKSRKFVDQLSIVKEIDLASPANDSLTTVQKKQDSLNSRSPILTRLRSAGKRSSTRNGGPTPITRRNRKSVAPSAYNSNGSTKYQSISISIPQPMPTVQVKNNSPVSVNGECDLNAKPIVENSKNGETQSYRYCSTM